MKVAILGGCVTRDMVHFSPREVQLALYVARTSFLSLAAEAVPVKLGQIHLEHAFNQKVLWGMAKVFWEKLKEARPHYEPMAERVLRSLRDRMSGCQRDPHGGGSCVSDCAHKWGRDFFHYEKITIKNWRN
jgi:hypothetical protein